MEPPLLPATRPRSLMTFGVINLILGVLALFSAVASIGMILSPATYAENPVIQVMERDAVYALFYKVMLVPGILGVLAQVASGIGLIKAKEWGRKLAMLWALYFLIVTPLTTWMLQTHVHPALIEQMTKASPNAATASMMKTTMFTMTIITAVLWCAFAILEIWMLARTKVRVYCQTRQ